MGKKGKKALAGKPKKLTPKDVGKRLNALAKNLEEELEGADLFAPLPPTEDCAICLVPMPLSPAEGFGICYHPCCGKKICLACYKENKESIDKQNEENSGKKIALTCPFCREPNLTCPDKEYALLQARCLQNDHNALTFMGSRYWTGEGGAPKDGLKALDCYIRAAELGSGKACGCIGIIYTEGNGVAIDKEKAALFERMGTLRGSIVARHSIGCSEYYDFGNHEIGIRHWKIAAEAGHQCSLNELRDIYDAYGKKPGKKFISEEYLDFATLACHEAQMEVTSEEREKHRFEE